LNANDNDDEADDDELDDDNDDDAEDDDETGKDAEADEDFEDEADDEDDDGEERATTRVLMGRDGCTRERGWKAFDRNDEEDVDVDDDVEVASLSNDTGDRCARKRMYARRRRRACMCTGAPSSAVRWLWSHAIETRRV
jgi:hypothetical protein